MTHWTSTHPTARIAHWCEMCGRSIRPGEKYRRGAGMDGATAWTWKECLHCAALVSYVSRLWFDDEGYGRDLFAEWEPETVEHLRIKACAVRRRWQRLDGSLYPVPEVKWHRDSTGFPRTVSLHMGADQ